MKFKVGRLMKEKLAAISWVPIDDDAKDVAEMSGADPDDDGDDNE